MNFNSQGLLISIIILIILMLICHISNYLYDKSKFLDVMQNNSLPTKSLPTKSLPTKSLPTQYNKIYYDNQLGYGNKDNKGNKGNNNIYDLSSKVSCSKLNQAEVPCNVVASCMNPTIPITTQYQLSDSELAVLYKSMYEEAGRELLLRALSN